METEYDAMGRQFLTRDNIAVSVDGSEDRNDARATLTTYGEHGRPVEMTYADGTSTRTQYDQYGRRTGEIDQLGRLTRYEYNEQGQLVAVELPEVADPQHGNLLTRPRYEYAYDSDGNHVLIRD